MEAFLIILSQALSYVFSTLTLWFCSHTVDTHNANLKTSAIYCAIMTIASLLLVGIIFLAATAGGLGLLVFIAFLLYIVGAVWLMTRMYNISVFSALWLCLAIWAVSKGVEWLLNAVFG